VQWLNVIEDGSFDDGDTYFIFNPGRIGPGTTEEALAPVIRRPVALLSALAALSVSTAQVEFTATKRFTNNFQFIASYVFSSLIGNYEGLFRNENGQSDPNITSLFDLQSLLDNTYGRLPNDRPHQFKFNGSYRTPWKLLVSGNFYAQSWCAVQPTDSASDLWQQRGFGVQRGTAIVPVVSAAEPGFPNTVESIRYQPLADDNES
jgi:hypothetical protein